MTDRPEDPTLSPYDDASDPETESFHLGPPEDGLDEAVDADPVAHALVDSEQGEVPQGPPLTGTPAEPALPADAPTIAVEHPTLINEDLAGPLPETTDTIVRRTSLLRPDDPDIVLQPLPEPVPAPPLDPYSEYSEFEKVPSRAGAHFWSAISILILTPVAWYLLSDAGARFTLASNAPWETGVVNYAALIEFVAGLVVLLFVILALRGSSLGAWITGPLLVLGGATFLVIPSQVQAFLDPYLTALTNYNAFGANLAHHLIADGSTGRFVIAGVALMAAGFVSHGARRAGKRQQRIEDALARRAD